MEIGADPLGNLQRLSNALEGMTGKMADVEQKLFNVEHQLETAKVEVTKPFAQVQEGEPDRAEDIQAVAEEPIKPVASFLMSERIAEHDKERMLADGQRGRISIREKLTEMKEKAFEYNMPDKRECSKSKDKQETLGLLRRKEQDV